MNLEIELPSRVPVMTLPEVAFFPKVMLPLYIFESRYRDMLKTSLSGDRMFAVAGVDNSKLGQSLGTEPAYEIATVGIIRGCRTQEDGTSQLILQGLNRVHLDELYEDKSYREAAITPLNSEKDADEAVLFEKRKELFSLIKKHSTKDPQIPEELLQLVESLEEPEDFVDLVAFSIVQNYALKQKALATLSVDKRFNLLINVFS